MKAWPFLVATVLLASTASALTQNGQTIPSAPGCDSGKPTGLGAIFACVCDKPNVCNIGAVCQNGVCPDGKNAVCESTMWHNDNDNTCIPSNLSGLDPQKDATVTPETFRPTCSLTFTMVSRGTALFKNIFGWYNVTSSTPDPSDLHPMLDCKKLTGESAVLDIQNDPAYKGGEVGFFLATPESTAGSSCADGDCCATIDRIKAGKGHVFYSQRGFNPDAKTGQESKIHLIIYDSKVKAHRFYFAWEDIFGGSSTNFSDFVTSVEGVECSGGGVACDTGKLGVCKNGVSACDNGVLGCTPLFQSAPEACDAVDNDCNGKVDDNATCPTNMMCVNGRCIGNCQSAEFPCTDPETVCNKSTNLCVPINCKDTTCDVGKVCREGKCIAPCEGVVCPRGQECMGDVCVDLCQSVTCGIGKICRSGVCFDGCGQCSGAACDNSLKCNTSSGECVDPSCSPACGAGFYCDKGSCKSTCDGVKCPGGKACSNGKCEGSITSDAGEDGNIPIQDSGSLDAGGFAGSGGSGGSGTDASIDGPGSQYAVPESSSGCGCAVPRKTVSGLGIFSFVAAAGAFISRRRNSRRKSA